MIRASHIGLCLVLLAGCAGAGGRVHYAALDPSYRPTELGYAARSGRIETRIAGNPFPVPQAAFERAVTEAMAGAHFGPRVAFLSSPAASHPYHVAMIFNGPAGASGAALCGMRHGAVPPAPEAGRVRLLAAFCRGGTALTQLSAAAEDVRGLEDPAFRRLVRQATLRLFPPDNPERRGDACLLAAC